MFDANFESLAFDIVMWVSIALIVIGVGVAIVVKDW